MADNMDRKISQAAAWDRQCEMYKMSALPSSAESRRRASGWESVEDAGRYWENVQEFQKERIDFLTGMLSPCAGRKVLDIGSGPGVLAIPLAEQGALVTAVDPSPGMISVLEAKKLERGLGGITCLNLPWEKVDVARDLDGPYDAVVASLSLMMDDIRGSLLKMKQVCRGRVHLVWVKGESTWEKHIKAIRSLLKSDSRVFRPGADLLAGIVRELGYEPEITSAPFPYVERFASRTAALEHMKAYFGVMGADQTGKLSGYLDTCLEPKDGACVLNLSAEAWVITW